MSFNLLYKTKKSHTNKIVWDSYYITIFYFTLNVSPDVCDTNCGAYIH